MGLVLGDYIGRLTVTAVVGVSVLRRDGNGVVHSCTRPHTSLHW
jgi:hypothetical protein